MSHPVVVLAGLIRLIQPTTTPEQAVTAAETVLADILPLVCSQPRQKAEGVGRPAISHQTLRDRILAFLRATYYAPAAQEIISHVQGGGPQLRRALKRMVEDGELFVNKYGRSIGYEMRPDLGSRPPRPA